MPASNRKTASRKTTRTKAAARKAPATSRKSAVRKPTGAAVKAPAKKSSSGKATSSRKSSPVRKSTAAKAPAKKAPAKKAPAKNGPTKKAPRKTPASKAQPKKVSVKKAPVKKTTGPKQPEKTRPAKAAPRPKTATGNGSAATTAGRRTPRGRNAVAAALMPDQPDRSFSFSGPLKSFKPYEPARNEHYMSDGMPEHFRRILLTWKQELMEEVDRTVHHMKDEAANFPDPNDRASQESEFGLELRTRDRERKLLKKIDEALMRIDDGTYGYCLETGEEIGLRRLEARPVATLTVEAQERRELAEKQYRDRDDR